MAAVVGLLTGALLPLSSFISIGYLRAMLVTLPTLVLWVRVASGEELRAGTWQSLGLTRKQWLATATGNVLAVSAIYAVTGIAAAALVGLAVPTNGDPIAAILFAALMGIAACMLAIAGSASWDGLMFVGPLAFWIPLRYPMDMHDPMAASELAVIGGIQGGLALLIAAVLLWRYVSGRGNISHKDTAPGLS
ncbi:hypothetical protein JKI95_07255 [Corynebacterium aquatimens]|uniref:hypothetical protein n=1 Tax=Corynebacterium aquatimens TaxID=1190508 RepID=UPI00254159B4|nr:hypothetical protein [Corynebacterium aquatimens]QYH19072.1 hypothetical protein JKI95_07255 [Corynebacterium aquatimens]